MTISKIIFSSIFINPALKNTYTSQLKILRHHIPIGIKHALQLLEKTKGDIDTSILLYKKDAIDIVCTKTSCSPEIAELYLQQHNYDTALTIQQFHLDQEEAILPATDKIPFNLMNLLMNGKIRSSHPHIGPVGTQVRPTGKNPDNMAWISILSRHGVDCSGEFPKYYFQNFEVEYLEVNEHYETCWNADVDLYLVKRETYYNIKTEADLENLLFTWLPDLSLLTHIQSTGHPNY